MMKNVNSAILMMVLILFLVPGSQPGASAATVTGYPVTGSSDTSDSSLILSRLSSDDGVRDPYNAPSSYNESIYQEYVFDFSIPTQDNIQINSVEVTFQVFVKKIEAAKLEAFDSTSTKQDYGIPGVTVNNAEVEFVEDISDHIDTPADVNNLVIRFLADGKGGDISDVDFVEVAVEYEATLLLAEAQLTAAAESSTVTFPHQIQVDDTAGTLNLSAVSGEGWTTRIYNDLNGDGDLDTGEPQISSLSVSAFQDVDILVQVDTPGSSAGTMDTITVTATNQGSGKSDQLENSLYVADGTAILPEYNANKQRNATASYSHTVYNVLGTQDTIGVTAVSDQGWTTRIYADADQNGVKDNSTVISQVTVPANDEIGIIVELDVPDVFLFIVDQTTVTVTGSTKGTHAIINRTNVVPSDPVVDGLKDEMYTSVLAQHQYFNYGPDPTMASGEVHYFVYNDSYYIYYEQSRNINDNTSGPYRHPSWAGQSHMYQTLVSSDFTEFIFYDESWQRKVAV